MKSPKRKRIVIGIDEGLPALVAASILRNQDFDLLAVHLRCDLATLGEDPTSYPSSMGASDLTAIEKFCESLGIPLRTIDVTEETLAKVYNPFWIATLGGGRFGGSATWAREILFPKLEECAASRGAEGLATGHFARLAPELYRYPERAFDQSRIFAFLDRARLERMTLPVGDVSVEMLLRLGREIGVIPKDDHSSLERDLENFMAARSRRGRWEWAAGQLEDPRVQARAAGDFFRPGPVIGADEVAVGEHRGVPGYQVGSPAPSRPGYFVKSIRSPSSTLLISNEEGMATNHFRVQNVVWSEPPQGGEGHRLRRIQVEKEPRTGSVSKIGPDQASGSLLPYPGGLAEVRLDSALYAISPGETLVFYEESRVLGSAKVAD
jgi:tRNA-specific 2-thiouridylase